jgi:hypothetical protein
MTPAEQRLHDELVRKIRVGWERNGFDDGLAGTERVPVGASTSVTDRYVAGYRDGAQVRAMRENGT